MNKYYQLLQKIIDFGKHQENKKGGITYLINEELSMSAADLLAIFETHPIAKKKLKAELDLYMAGEVSIEKYNEAGITWWDYCKPEFKNSYPKYFEKLPKLIEKINKEKRNSKNYVLFIGETGVETNQLPCLSLLQFQIDNGELVMTVYQRSCDSNLGLPSDIYQMYLVTQMIDIPLKNITFYIGKAHIYDNNLEKTKELLAGGQNIKFDLNV